MPTPGSGTWVLWLEVVALSPRLSRSLIRRPFSNAVGAGSCPEFLRPTHPLRALRSLTVPGHMSHNQAASTFSAMCLAVQIPRRPKFLQ